MRPLLGRLRAWGLRVLLALAGRFWHPRPAQPVRRILLLEMTRLGDAVAASALLEPLARAFPGAKLEVAVAAPYAPLFEGLAQAHGLAPGAWAFLRGAWALRPRLDDGALLVVSASPAVRNSVLVLLSRPGRACGYLFPRAGRPLEYDAPAPLKALGGGWQGAAVSEKGLHMVARAQAALAVAGLADAGSAPKLASGVLRQGKRVVLHAGANWDRRRWPLERFVELAGALAAEGAQCLLIPAEAGDSGRLPPGVELGEGLGLLQLRDALAGASLYIGNDSGPLHLAAALGTPCLALFGPNLVERSGPWPQPGPGSPHRALWEEVPCRPCAQTVCVQPWDWCMGKLSTARVLAEARAMIS